MLFKPDDFNIRDQFQRTRNGVSLTLFPSVSGSGYALELQRSTDGGSTWVTIHTVSPSENSTNGVFFFDAIGVNGQTVWYRDRQKDADGNCSDWALAVAAVAKRYVVNAQGVPIGTGVVDLSDPGNLNVDGDHINRTGGNTTKISGVLQHHTDAGHLYGTIQDGSGRLVAGFFHTGSNTADHINDGSGKRVTSLNEASGGGFGYTHLDGTGLKLGALARGRQYTAGRQPTIIVAGYNVANGTPLGDYLISLGYSVTKASGSSVATCRSYDVVLVDYWFGSANVANSFIQSLVDDGQKVLVTGNDSGQSGGLFYITSTTTATPNGTVSISSKPHPITDNLGTSTVGTDSDNGAQITGAVTYAQYLTFYASGYVNSMLLEYPNGALILHDQSLSNLSTAPTTAIQTYTTNIIEYLGGGLIKQPKGSAGAAVHLDRTGVRGGSIIRSRALDDGNYAAGAVSTDGLTLHQNATNIGGHKLGGMYNTGSHTADVISAGSVKRIPLVGATDSSGNVDFNGSAWVNKHAGNLGRSAGDGTPVGTVVQNLANDGNMFAGMQDSAGRTVNQMFHKVSDDLDSAKGGSTNRPLIAYTAVDNMAENANFEAAATTWASIPGYGASSAIITLDSSSVYGGTKSLKVSSSAQFGAAVSVARWKVRPGDYYFVSGAVKSNFASDQADIQLQFLDKNGGYLSGVQAASSATSWTGVSATGQAPVSTSYAILSLQNNSANGGVCWFDDIFVTRVSQTTNEVSRGATMLGNVIMNLQDTGHLSGSMQDSGGRGVNLFLAKLLSGNSDSMDGLPDGTTYIRPRRVVSSVATAPAQTLYSAFNGSSTSTSEVSVSSYTLPASTMSTNGDTIRISTVVNLTNASDIFKMKFGSTILFNGSLQAGLWLTTVYLTRLTNTSQSVAVPCIDPSGQPSLGAVSSASETLSNPLTIDFRAIAASGGKVAFVATTVELLPV